MPHGFEDIESADEDGIIHEPAQEDAGPGACNQINGELKDKVDDKANSDEDDEEIKEKDDEDDEDEQKDQPEKEAPEASQDADDVSDDDAEGVAKGEEDLDDDMDEEEEEHFIVQTIRKHKFVEDAVYYYIKWQGYPEKDNTWEPEEHLIPHARQLLADYHEKIGGIPKPRIKKTRSRRALREEPSFEDPQPKKRQRRGEDASTADDSEDQWLPDTEDWEPLVAKVETIESDGKGQYNAYLKFTNGKRTKVSTKLIRRHCPRPLVDFYEGHLKFT
ncbi:hypothetical protein AYL99_01164 [Fonsecaea erecta]|uniref:Chromo domain-containing protein n=1 Tax=Fonsecaea erecta TaxID=1367422 RepID=A0A178ZZN1_9EURO|nr:hypothetical protein AYL99_01164 [Fonsecaea erecta]OAP65192.1 hypothetical protein AYL99_01164 [Fonsecaea erecta]